MQKISQVQYRRHSTPNLSSDSFMVNSFSTIGLRNSTRCHSNSNVLTQKPLKTHRPEDIFTNPAGARLSQRLQYLFSKYLLVSLKGQRPAIGDIPRPVYGVMHAIRSALWVPLLLSCYPDEKLSSSEKEALMITASLYNSEKNGGHNKSYEEWDKQSALNCERELKYFGFDLDIINKCKNAILNKNADESFFSKILHDCDHLESMRLKPLLTCRKLHISNIILFKDIYDIIGMIISVFEEQGDLQCHSLVGSSPKRYIPANYDLSIKSYFEFAENALATHLFWLNNNSRLLYQKITKGYECLLIDESYQLLSIHDRFSGEHIKTKVISPILRLHIDDPETVKRTGLFVHNTKLNDLISLSLNFIFHELVYIADEKLEPYISESLKMRSTFEFAGTLMRLGIGVKESIEALRKLFDGRDDDIDYTLVFMDIAETYMYIKEFSWPTDKAEIIVMVKSKLYNLRQPMAQFCKISEVATTKYNSEFGWYTSYRHHLHALLKRNYLKHTPPESEKKKERVVYVERLDQPPFTQNRNMNSRYGFHQFKINQQNDISLKSAISAHNLSEFSSNGWDQKLYHGTQRDNFCHQHAKITGSRLSKRNPLASNNTIGFHADIDPCNSPMFLATRKADAPSYIVELNAGPAKQWTNGDKDPGWILLEGEKPENAHAEKVYCLSHRVIASINTFNQLLV